MQTLKTAIVVVLLLTVMYGAYVSLTAPPPELPAELVQVIDWDDSSVDIGMPDSFGDPGQPSASFDPIPSPAPTERAVSNDTRRDATGTTGRLSDEESFDMTPAALPKPDPTAGSVTADPNRDYPSTGQMNFDLAATPPSGAEVPTADEGSRGAGNGEGQAADIAGDALSLPSSPLPAPSQNGESPDAATPPSGARLAGGAENAGLANAIETADRQVSQDRLKEALATLSLFYSSPDLKPAERQQLLQRLDPLAGDVIYSKRHLLEQPYRVAPRETLTEIAMRHQVPWQLLANINGLSDPQSVLPGNEMKVVKGPFRAEVDLSRGELTVFLGELYAGRFPFEAGADPAPEAGTYTVQDKQTERAYYGLQGDHFAAGDPRNPYGNVWLDLGKRMCIHGRPESGEVPSGGCIRLQPSDARDVYGILSQGSEITIRR